MPRLNVPDPRDPNGDAELPVHFTVGAAGRGAPAIELRFALDVTNTDVLPFLSDDHLDALRDAICARLPAGAMIPQVAQQQQAHAGEDVARVAGRPGLRGRDASHLVIAGRRFPSAWIFADAAAVNAFLGTVDGAGWGVLAEIDGGVVVAECADQGRPAPTRAGAAVGSAL